MPVTQTEARQAEFGMIGLGVMGSNLALNIEEHGFSVAVWNYETDWVDRFIHQHGERRFTGAKTLEDFARALERPRRIMMMIKAGAPIDMTLDKLRPLLDEGDILIDGGNSFFKDTERREQQLHADGLSFMGVGVSGGEEGARTGPSLMPGGGRAAYERTRQVFEAIAAKSEAGPCVTYVGPGGAGHFVKMVHNGIEYADMQLIAEAYDMLRRGLGMEAAEMADTFSEWDRGPLESFLIEATATILRVRDDETGRPLVDLVLDAAEQKGTGKWTAQQALELAVSVPTISAAIDARFVSGMKDQRVEASRVIKGPRAKRFTGDRRKFIRAVHDALYASKICSYAQGMSLIGRASDEFQWAVDLGEMARIWKAGCIIRARLLDPIREAYERRREIANLLLDRELNARVQRAQPGWRLAVKTACGLGIPVPAMSASLSYFDGYRTASLPQNLTQAQRDYFGSHTYERIDHREWGAVHTDWEK
jgi:6-phosphogluconate dehydrogenase